MSSSATSRKSCLPKRPSAFAFEVIGFGSVTVMPASSHAHPWPVVAYAPTLVCSKKSLSALSYSVLDAARHPSQGGCCAPGDAQENANKGNVVAQSQGVRNTETPGSFSACAIWLARKHIVSKRSSLRSRGTTVFPKQRPQRTAHHGLAITAQVFFIHRFFVGLSGFGFHRNFRSQ
jgi:hypothetical protein